MSEFVFRGSGKKDVEKLMSMVVSPAPSNASTTTSFKPSASQQTYSGQIKKKKKIKRVLDSDDETPCMCLIYSITTDLPPGR